MKLTSGVDLVDIKRMSQALERHGDRLLSRVYTPDELQEVGSNLASLAARFAAKEAVAKALGTGIGMVAWQEIEILRGEARQPVLNLKGAAAQLAAEKGFRTWSISLSHTHDHAIALVVAIGN